MEKAWAKLVGSYAAIEGGSSWWTLMHLTNDPTERVIMRDQGYTSTNAKGVALWAKLLDYTSKEYLMFTGSDSKSYVTNHSFALLQAVALPMPNGSVNMVQMRNPWKGDDGWKGDYSKTKGGSKYADLLAALKTHQGGLKEEAGKFWMSFDDCVKEYSTLFIGHSQETRTPGGAERAEYRPTIDLSSTVNRQFARITMYEDLDLTNEIFSLENFQGGNRVGTVKNTAIQKVSTGKIRYGLYPALAAYDGQEF